MGDVWAQPARIPELCEGEVHLWRLHLNHAHRAQTISALFADLTPEEQAHALSMRAVEAREQFIGARGLLRRLLGDACGTDPGRIVLGTGVHKKPFLNATQALDFNVSHARQLILISVSRAGPIGVDVEFIDRNFAESGELLEIARQALIHEDVLWIERAVSPQEQIVRFFRLWTRMEAVAKADGRGIASSLKYVPQSAPDDVEFKVTVISNGSRSGVDYFVRTADVGAHHLCAYATLRSGLSAALFDAAHLFD